MSKANKEFFEALALMEQEKGISAEYLAEKIENAIVTAVKRDYNNKDIVFCEIDTENKDFRVFVRKNVVTEILDPDEDMTVEQAQRFKKNALAGDIVEIELETKEVSRIAAEKGKHILRQAIREAEHGRMKEEFHQVITLYYGEVVKEEEAAALAETIAEKYPDCDVDFHNGGQAVYYYIMSLE